MSIAEDVCHEVQQDETDEDISITIAEVRNAHVIGSLLNVMLYIMI